MTGNGVYLGAGSAVTKGLWHFEGNSNDSSGNSNNGTDTSITYSLANGQFNQGAGFNGTTSNIIVGTGLNTTLSSGAWTISMWIKPTSPANPDFYMACDHSSGARQFALGHNGSKIYFERNGASIITGIGSTVTSNYQNVHFTYDNTNIRSYINGVINTTTAMTALLSSVNSLYLGQRQYPANEGWYTGNLDEIIIENVTWSPEKVKKHYTYSKGRFGL